MILNQIRQTKKLFSECNKQFAFLMSLLSPFSKRIYKCYWFFVNLRIRKWILTASKGVRKMQGALL